MTLGEWGHSRHLYENPFTQLLSVTISGDLHE